jgi:hypothetical protein
MVSVLYSSYMGVIAFGLSRPPAVGAFTLYIEWGR